MSVIKNGKCVGDKNAALEHCWGVIAAKDRRIAALEGLLRLMIGDDAAPICRYDAAIQTALAASPATDPAEAMRAKCAEIEWRRVNDDPFEYAIRQGTHGDEFVKKIDGACVRRAALKGNGEGL